MSLDRPLSEQELVAKARQRGASVVGLPGETIALGPNSPLRHTAARRPRATDLEHPIQVEVIAWADDPATLPQFPELKTLYAVPNWFGSKTKRQGARAKAEGRRSGMPDLCLPTPRTEMVGVGGLYGVAGVGAAGMGSGLYVAKVYGALYVEMKAESGSVRKSQRDRIAALRAAGNRCEVAMSADAAKAIITHYLSLPRP